MSATTTCPDRTTPPATVGFKSLTIPPLRDVAVSGERITLHVVDLPDSPVNNVCLLWDANGLAQPDAHTKIAHSIARKLILEGTTRRSGNEIADYIDYQGAWLTPASGCNGALSLLCMPDKTEAMLSLMAEVFADATMPEAAFCSTQRRLAGERRLATHRIATIADDAARCLRVGLKHPYALPVTESQIMEVTHRQTVDAFHAATRRSPLHVLAIGDMKGGTRERLLRFCNDLAAICDEPVAAPDYVPFAHEEAPVTRHIDVADQLQTAISAFIPVPLDRSHPDYIPLRYTVIALGGYFGSRLMSNIRERKGLTYSIGASLEGTFEGTSMTVSAQCAAGTAPLAVDEIRNEIHRLATVPMDKNELERLRQYNMTALASTLDSPPAILQHYINQYQVGTPADYFVRQFDTLRRLDAETIRTMATTYLDPDALTVVTAGAR